MKRKILVGLISLTLGLSLASCNVVVTPNGSNSNQTGENTTSGGNETSSTSMTQVNFTGENLKIGQSFKLLGTVTRQHPEERNEGSPAYPTYGTSIPNITDEQKDALLAESSYLRSSSTTYDSMDKDGNLYLNGEKLNRKLYKHTTASYNYYGSPDPNELALIKEITTEARPGGNHLTGLYAPAGEVITVEMTEEDLKNTGGVKIEIGQYSQNNQLNNIWKDRNDFSRMPEMGNEMLANETTSYVGSFLGGPIYITPNKQCTFTVKISGALEYCHFIYGLTTEEEFNRLKEKSAPYFDLEVWDKCVRHSGPKAYANLDYDNLNKISAFWLSVSNISRQIPMGSSANLGIDFLYDPFVAAGAAVAFVGRNWCNLPPDWMNGALDYEGFMTNGNWGPIHEYNHHFQRYGFVPGDEVTNNALSLLSYINYTQISANRPNLDGWNKYLNPATSFKETLEQNTKGESTSSLNTYADIIHTFGVDTFIKAAKNGKGQGGADTWYKALSDATGYNMNYYFSLLNQTVSDEVSQSYNTLKPFIPVTLNEQTGKVINGNEIVTVLPYPIDLDKDYTIDLDTSLTMPQGFTYTIKNITKPSNGTLRRNGNILTYTPLGMKTSGKIKLTIELKNESLNLKSEETIIFELKPQYQGINKITYTYSGNIYNSIDEAEKANFKDYTNISTEIVNKHFINGISYNQICIYHGKIYMPKTGDYTISVRTSNRSNTRLRLGLNTKEYSKTISSPRNAPINLNDTNVTFTVTKGDYIYFEVIIQSYHPDGFAELFGGYDNNLKSISTGYLLNDDATKASIRENSDNYPRSYNGLSKVIPNTNARVISYTESFASWDETTKIENIVDGDISTSYHSIRNKYITTEPFEFTVDLGNAYTVNTLMITGYNGNSRQNPTAFKLYGGTNTDNMTLLGEYSDITYSGRNAAVSFKETYLRYYKIVITDTYEHRYVAMSELQMAIKVNDNLVNPVNANYYVKNNQSFTKEFTQAFYGYVIKGNGIIILDTTNDYFGIKILESNAKIKLTINGNEQIVKFDELYYIKLNSKNNHIEIEILDNDVSIESFIY